MGLHRRGVRAHHQVTVLLLLTASRTPVDVEGVLHLAGRVIDVEVERIEVEPLVLDLRTLGDVPAHGNEEVSDLFHERLQGVARTGGAAARGDRDVH